MPRATTGRSSDSMGPSSTAARPACHGSGTGSPAARAARARAMAGWPDRAGAELRCPPATPDRCNRRASRAPVAIHLSRAADSRSPSRYAEPHRLTRIASFYETETQIPRPTARPPTAAREPAEGHRPGRVGRAIRSCGRRWPPPHADQDRRKPPPLIQGRKISREFGFT